MSLALFNIAIHVILGTSSPASLLPIAANFLWSIPAESERVSISQSHVSICTRNWDGIIPDTLESANRVLRAKVKRRFRQFDIYSATFALITAKASIKFVNIIFYIKREKREKRNISYHFINIYLIILIENILHNCYNNYTLSSLRKMSLQNLMAWN